MSAGFDAFLKDLNDSYPEVEYASSKHRERSSEWFVKRIEKGKKGIDVGGTEPLCEKLRAKGVDVTYVDLFPPKSFPKYVKTDMFNILDHYQPKSLDFITTRHTLEHSFAPLFQLWAYNRILKDDGELFVIVPQHNRDWVWFPTHHNCLPPDNWLMLFYRTGFKVIEADAGTWKPEKSNFIEYRYRLGVEARGLRLGWEKMTNVEKRAGRPGLAD